MSSVLGTQPRRARYRLDVRRLVALAEVKGIELLKIKGFQRAWINTPRRRVQPKTSDAIRLAVHLEVPVECLFGAAPEYKNSKPWEIATHASLDIFLKRDPEGRRAGQFRELFEQHAQATAENAPKTVAAWTAALDLIVRARAQQTDEIRQLNQSMGPGGVHPQA